MNEAYLKQKRILLVDDEQALLDLVVSILQMDGYQRIRTAGTVADALLAAQEFQPELAVLDVMLPDDDGFALMEALQRQGREYPILFLTARGEDEDKFRGYGLGADDYIVKPFLPRELTYKITAILRRCYKAENPLVSLRDSQIDFERGEVAKDRAAHSPHRQRARIALGALSQRGQNRHHRRALRSPLGRQSLWL